MKVALVVQRYGPEVHGGAESLGRRMAELLAQEIEIDVITTCAIDYLTWENHYEPGVEREADVTVRRFEVPQPRDYAAFDEASLRAYDVPDDLQLGRAWMRAQGPNSPALLEYLRTHGREYDAVVFVTYLYATTAEGLPLVADRAVLVPTMHDEPPLRLRIFDELFARARLCLFSTPEERELARDRFGVRDERARVVGAGIEERNGDPSRFVAASGVERPYALYHGRLDPSKGVVELVDHHASYLDRVDGAGLDLVLVGSGTIALPNTERMHTLGFVSDELKDDAIAGATVVVCPSPYESLSLSQLEAWTHGRPTLSNAVSPVLVGQSRRSGGGLWYEDSAEYSAMLDLLAGARPLADAIGAQGRRYVRENYSWDRVRDEWLSALEEVATRARAESR